MSWNPAQSVRLLKQGSDSSLPPVWIMPVFSGPHCGALVGRPQLKTLSP